MKTLVRTNYTKWYMLIGLFVLIIAFAGTSLAAHTITVTVGVSKNLVAKHPVSAIGYSINNDRGHGALGRTYKGSGPAGAKYSFGFKSKGKSISCGPKGGVTLNQNSTVVFDLNSKGQCVLSITKK